jgi:hypothetical protein
MSDMIESEPLLERFGLLTEEAVASMIGISRQSLKNRPVSQLPEFVKVGRRRLFKEASVREFFGVFGLAPPPRPSDTKMVGGLQPRGLNKEEAARYVGLDPQMFGVLVD